MRFRTNRFTFEKFPPPPPLLHSHTLSLSFSLSLSHTHTHTHTSTHTHTHTRTHTHTHTHTHKHSRAHTYTQCTPPQATHRTRLVSGALIYNMIRRKSVQFQIFELQGYIPYATNLHVCVCECAHQYIHTYWSGAMEAHAGLMVVARSARRCGW